MPSVSSAKPSIPTLWLDTSVGIKLAKVSRGEKLQEIEVERGKKLQGLVLKLVQEGKLLCPESDQEEEYDAGRLEKEIAGEFSRLSLGVRLRHRMGILDSQIYYAMKAYCRKEETIPISMQVYFHRDPIEQARKALESGFTFDIAFRPDTELLARRAAAKVEILSHAEKLRQELTKKQQKYETQLKLELCSFADSVIEQLRNYQQKLQAGIPDIWDMLGVTGVGLYNVFWKELGGQPPGLSGLIEFLKSEYFMSLPICKIRAQLYADLVTGNEKIQSGDSMDIELLAVAIPLANFLLIDKKMENRVKRLGIDKEWGAQVFSMATIDGLIAELEEVK